MWVVLQTVTGVASDLLGDPGVFFRVDKVTEELVRLLETVVLDLG